MMTLPTGALERYRRARPDVAVSTVSASGSSVLEGLAAGAVDAVVSVPMGEDAFAYLPVHREPLCVVLRGEGAGPLEALRGRTLFGVAQDHPIEAQIGAYLAGRGIPVRLSYDYPGAMLALEAMEAGLGGCIMTASAARRLLERGGYCVVSLDGPDAPQWEVGVTYRKGSSKQAAIADLARHLGA